MLLMYSTASAAMNGQRLLRQTHHQQQHDQA
jgi:hypothetical protein